MDANTPDCSSPKGCVRIAWASSGVTGVLKTVCIGVWTSVSIVHAIALAHLRTGRPGVAAPPAEPRRGRILHVQL